MQSLTPPIVFSDFGFCFVNTTPRDSTRLDSRSFNFLSILPRTPQTLTAQWPTLLMVVSSRTSSPVTCLANPSSRLRLRSFLPLHSASDTFAILSSSLTVVSLPSKVCAETFFSLLQFYVDLFDSPRRDDGAHGALTSRGAPPPHLRSLLSFATETFFCFFFFIVRTAIDNQFLGFLNEKDYNG